MVEHEPSKLVVWVRFPSPAPTLRSKVDPEGATKRSTRRTLTLERTYGKRTNTGLQDTDRR